MARRLTSAQQLLLADCVRSALIGWLQADPAYGQAARRWHHQATTIAGFSFSRFANLAIAETGKHYMAGSPTSPHVRFPLGVRDTAALANLLEMQPGMATDDTLRGAGLIACHSPYGQPSVCGREWKTYIGMLKALGLSIDDDRPGWRDEARHELRHFSMEVGAAALENQQAAE
jgi:hypothetical protein